MGAAQQVLRSFDHLPLEEQREVAVEILRRTASLDLPPLSDEELVLSAEALFPELDRTDSSKLDLRLEQGT